MDEDLDEYGEIEGNIIYIGGNGEFEVELPEWYDRD